MDGRPYDGRHVLMERSWNGSGAPWSHLNHSRCSGTDKRREERDQEGGRKQREPEPERRSNKQKTSWQRGFPAPVRVADQLAGRADAHPGKDQAVARHIPRRHEATAWPRCRGSLLCWHPLLLTAHLMTKCKGGPAAGSRGCAAAFLPERIGKSSESAEQWKQPSSPAPARIPREIPWTF